MNTVIEQMLDRYDPKSDYERINALKEIMQEITLSGLSRAGFFKQAAFYGGTALRIFYGLDRFSEDLDFSLMEKNVDFDLSEWFDAIEREVNSYGMNVSVQTKQKTKETAIHSAFLKGNTREHLLYFYKDSGAASRIPGNEAIRIKFEIDTEPPEGATFENKYRLLPAPFEVTMYDEASLFAGKLHAVICRNWKNRVKGRDLYDYVFFLTRGAKVNLPHLKARLTDSGTIKDSSDLSLDEIKGLLYRRFESIDYDQARNDVLPFISDPSVLNVWGEEFFKQITDMYLVPRL